MSGFLSRRALLAASAGVLTGTSGCIDAVDIDVFGEPAGEETGFEARYTTQSLSQPVIRGGPTPDSGPPYVATLITSQSQAEDVLNLDAIPERVHSKWHPLDYSEKYIAVFISRLKISPSGVAEGDNPRALPRGNTFVFSLDGTVEEELGDRLFTVMERWRVTDGSPPDDVVVNLRYDTES